MTGSGPESAMTLCECPGNEALHGLDQIFDATGAR